MDIIDKLADTAINAIDLAYEHVTEQSHVEAQNVLHFVERLTKMCHSIEDHMDWLDLNLRQADLPAPRVDSQQPVSGAPSRPAASRSRRP